MENPSTAGTPGGKCPQAAGVLKPLIDLSKCEGAAECEKVCPYGVFQLRAITAAERESLSWRGRVKTLFHGPTKAFAVAAESCHACGLCVAACPERAITLIKA